MGKLETIPADLLMSERRGTPSVGHQSITGVIKDHY